MSVRLLKGQQDELTDDLVDLILLIFELERFEERFIFTVQNKFARGKYVTLTQVLLEEFFLISGHLSETFSCDVDACLVDYEPVAYGLCYVLLGN